MNPKPVRWGDNFCGILCVKFIFARTLTKFITAEVCLESCNANKDFAEASFTKCDIIEIVSWYGPGLHVQKVCYLEAIIRKQYQPEQMGTILEMWVMHYLVKSQIRKGMNFL